MNAEKIPSDQKNSPVTGKKKKSGCMVFFLASLSILLVLSSLIAVFGYDIWRVAFNPTLVKQMLTDEIVNSPLVPRVLEDMSLRRAQERVDSGESLSGVNEPDIILLLSYVGYEEWDQIRSLVITEEFVTHVVSTSVDSLYSWIDSSDAVPQLVWDMSELKERLIDQPGEDAIMVAYEQLPECTDEEVADFTGRLAAVPPGVEVLYNLCQFPEPWFEDQVDDYIHALIDINQNIPDDYDFSMLLGSTGLSGGTLAAVKTFLRLMRFVGHWGWIMPLALIVLIAAIGVRSFGDLGKWIGIPLLIVGLLVIGTVLLVKPPLIEMLTNSISSELSDLLRNEVMASLTRLSDHIFQPMLFQGAIILGVGVLLVIVMIIASIIKHKKAKKAAQVEEKAE
jgi:hypothetical protein